MGRFSDLRKKAKEKEKKDSNLNKKTNLNEETVKEESVITKDMKTESKPIGNVPLPSSGLAEDILSNLMHDKPILIQEDKEQVFVDQFSRVDNKKIQEALLQFIIFSLENEKYAIEIFNVVEIIPPKKITRVPKLNKTIKGVLNIRGTVIPVIDIREMFNLPEKKYDKETKFVIIEYNRRKLTIIVDKIYNVANISIEKIDGVPTELKRNIGSENLTGITNLESDAVAILDIEKIINYRESKGG